MRSTSSASCSEVGMTEEALLLQLNENLKTICRDVGELKGGLTALEEKIDDICEEVKTVKKDVDKLKGAENRKIGMAIAASALISALAWCISWVA
ncbi:hypothetical protein [Methanococcoides sp. FTZ1]|uniref:hypothetical protein n=1 Tax=Methanococcoides sp. FTZ1 TaxID=3439061 RepID=UPI003F842040